jgi:hypothetical protein
MPSYNTHGERYPVASTRSEGRFHVHVMGVPVLAGTLPVNGGELVIHADGGIRMANFQLSATGLPFKAPASPGGTRRMFGSGDDAFGDDAFIDFETQWARAAGTGHHELDGVLRFHGQERVLTLRAEHGFWLHDGLGAQWYRTTLRGGLDRKAWDLPSSPLTDAALRLFGHDVHFEVALYAGPRVTTEPEDSNRPSAGAGRHAYAHGPTVVHAMDAGVST